MATIQVMLSAEQNADRPPSQDANQQLSSELRQESRQQTRRTLASFLKGGTVAAEDDSTVPWLRFRQQLFKFFDDPQTSRIAFSFSIYFVALIVFSTLTFVLQTIDSLNSSPDQLYAWNVIEVFVISQFTADYLIRICCCPRLLRFVIAPLNLIDIVAILPFWIELGLILSNTHTNASGLAVVRVIRLLRVLRLMKLGKNSGSLKLVAAAMYRSREGIVLLLFMITLAMVLFSSAMYFAETAYCDFDPVALQWTYNNQTLVPGVVTPFQSIVATFWWAIVTMTTVGYGDTFPQTGAGKAVGAVTIVAAILVLAFPITIISGNLNEVYSEFRREEAENKRVAEIRKATLQLADNTKHSAVVLKELLGEYADPNVLTKEIAHVNQQLEKNMDGIAERMTELHDLRATVEKLRDKLTLYAEFHAQQKSAAAISASSAKLVVKRGVSNTSSNNERSTSTVVDAPV